ncbi:MAG: DUF4097 family beta strand repeat-containing protein [Terriglobales bacterium]
MNHNDLMTKLLVGAGLAAAFALTLSSAAPAQTTGNSYQMGASPLISVDNVSGSIVVVGDGGSQVRYTAVETNPDNASNVEIRVTTTNDSLELYVDGPFRHHSGDDWDREDRAANRVKFDFELHVPAGARVELRSVNGRVSDTATRGGFRVRTVNGSIDLEQMAGAGTANTVNGSVTAGFSSNPADSCKFGTVNGKLSLYMPAGLNADLSYHTMNGSVYSDYAVQPLSSAPDESRRGRMIVIRRTSSGRIGNGGPALELSTLNGNIYLHESKAGAR